jgi:branched-chain amino acid transport system ATP-binding protein
MTALLEVKKLERRFGGLLAVADLSFDVAEGEIVSIIGPNGAGKTTAFNVITNIYPATAGTVRFKGELLNTLPVHRISARGVARTFQNLRIFPNLTVRDNVLVGLAPSNRTALLATVLRSPAQRRAEQQLQREADMLLELLGLEASAEQLARELPYGAQRRVEIARALATHPELLLLDEPAAGMNPAEIADLIELIRRLRGTRVSTIVLIEHHMNVVMTISDRVIVMDQGEKIAEGPPDQVRSDRRVIQAYLGSTAA